MYLLVTRRSLGSDINTEPTEKVHFAVVDVSNRRLDPLGRRIE